MSLNLSNLPGDWRFDARCDPQTAEEWFPTPGANQTTTASKRICRTCPVVNECLAHALTFDEVHGIWGGTTEAERRALKRNGRRIDIEPDEDGRLRCPSCGAAFTYPARYARHVAEAHPKEGVA